mgnify:CR=1 FL=1
MPVRSRRRLLPRSAALLLLAPLLANLGSVAFAAEPNLPDKVDYRQHVQPLLAAQCYACHSALRQKGALRLDAGKLILAGGESGPAVQPGKSNQSLLIDAVTTAEQVSAMPQDAEKLSAEEVALLKTWIDQGASFPSDEVIPADPAEHWAFRRPQKPAVPDAEPGAGSTPRTSHPIDAFLAVRQKQTGVVPAPPADKATLLRRVYLDLVGMPPTRAELHAFLADDSADAYRRVVQQLLNDPRYGERWGRHWMDVWRYSDWAGYRNEIRNSQKHIWHWRDYIVESLNQDRPYDQMVRDMLAADELSPTDPFAIRATGFLARNWFKFNRNTWLESTVEHTGKAFLGLTLNCARCHDHMYDPISQQDYYRFRAFFETHDIRTDRVEGEADIEQDGIPRAFDGRGSDPTYLFVRGDERHPDKSATYEAAWPRLFGDEVAIEAIELPVESYYPGFRTHVQEEAIAAAEAALSAARTEWEQARAELPADDVAPAQPPQQTIPPSRWELAEVRLAVAQAKRNEVQAVIAADRAKYGEASSNERSQQAQAAQAAQRTLAVCRAHEQFLLATQSLAELESKTPVASGAAPPAAIADARKKMDAAQQQWQAAQKAAAAAPSENYEGFSPVYPQGSSGRRAALARWITSPENPLTARVAVNQMWLRHFGQPLVGSVFDFGRNGQQPSHPELLDWLAVEFMESGWQMKQLHTWIVTSEAYCRAGDQAGLARRDANRQLDPDNVQLWHYPSRRLEGEIVRDSTLAVAGLLDPTMGGAEIDQNAGQNSKRRSIYFRHAHEKQMEFLKIFDAANVNECYRRGESIIPQQALAQANSPLTREAARAVAESLSACLATEATDADFVLAAFEQVLSRRPTTDEQQTCEDYLRRQTAMLKPGGDLTPFSAGPTLKRAASSDPGQRARESLVHVLLNHHEFVTIR